MAALANKISVLWHKWACQAGSHFVNIETGRKTSEWIIMRILTIQ